MKMTFPASMDKLHQMLEFIRQQVRAAGFEGQQETKVELALEEAIVNIIKHGYEKSSGNIAIDCMRIPYIGIKVTLIDKGIPFNPLLNQHKIDALSHSEKVTSGGYGIYLFMTIMNQVDYEYHEGRNILTMMKFLNDSTKFIS